MIGIPAHVSRPAHWWPVVQKRLPAVTVTLISVLGAVTAAAAQGQITGKVGAWVAVAGPIVLAFLRSVAPGAHGADYEQGLVPERRGTGSRTGELPTATVPPAPHGVADAGTHADDGTPL